MTGQRKERRTQRKEYRAGRKKWGRKEEMVWKENRTGN